MSAKEIILFTGRDDKQPRAELAPILANWLRVTLTESQPVNERLIRAVVVTS